MNKIALFKPAKVYKYSKIKDTIKGRILSKSCVFKSDLQFLIRDK